MGTKNNPGSYDCYANAEPDEPMFVLLGRDPSAWALVQLWADLRERMGESPEKIAEARRCAEAMLDWANKTKARKVVDAAGLFQEGVNRFGRLRNGGWKILETDNDGRDYPSECFVACGIQSEQKAKTMCEALNDRFSGDHAPRFFRVVPGDHQLAKPFEP